MKPMKTLAVRLVASFGVFLAVAVCVNDVAFANGTVRETQYSTSLTEATGIVRILVAVFGGMIGILGIVVAIKWTGENRLARVLYTLRHIHHHLGQINAELRIAGCKPAPWLVQDDLPADC